MIITNTFAIFQKELQNYFNSPLAYIVATIFWLIGGLFLFGILFGEQGIIQQVALMQQMGDKQSYDLPYMFLREFFTVIGSLCLFVLPILSMGLYTEERKRGTIELLATSPISNWVVALGKLLGVVALFMFMVAPFLLYEAIIFSAANPPVTLLIPLLAHIGLILLATAILSWGMFISSLTDSNILAAILTFALVLFFWVMDLIANNIGGFLGEALKRISLLQSYTNLIQGICDTGNLILLISYIFLGLFLTAQSVEFLKYTKQ